MDMSKLWEIVEDREAWHAAICGVCKKSDVTEQQCKLKPQWDTTTYLTYY